MERKLKYEPIPENAKVEKIETPFDTVGGARRNEPSADVSDSGHVRTNREGGEDWQAFFEDQGIDPKQPWVTLSASKTLGSVFMHAAKETDVGAVAVKFDEANRVYTTHFGSAFKQCPSLRPTGKVEARFKPSLDHEGKPCLAVKVKGATPKRKGAATPEEMAVRAEEEAAKKVAKSAVKKRIAAAKEVTAAVKPPTEEQP